METASLYFLVRCWNWKSTSWARHKINILWFGFSSSLWHLPSSSLSRRQCKRKCRQEIERKVLTMSPWLSGPRFAWVAIFRWRSQSNCPFPNLYLFYSIWFLSLITERILCDNQHFFQKEGHVISCSRRIKAYERYWHSGSLLSKGKVMTVYQSSEDPKHESEKWGGPMLD